MQLAEPASACASTLSVAGLTNPSSAYPFYGASLSALFRLGTATADAVEAAVCWRAGLAGHSWLAVGTLT